MAQSLRVLEIGCGFGDALRFNAQSFPYASFVGVDIDGDAIAHAQTHSLSNLRFLHGTAAEQAFDEGSFDIILCHGLFSWLGADVRHELLRDFARLLTPHGILCVSALMNPGFLVRETLARWIKLDQSIPTRERLAILKEKLPYEFEKPFSLLLHRELLRLEEESDALIEAELLTKTVRADYLGAIEVEFLNEGLFLLGDVRLQRSRIKNPMSFEGRGTACEEYDLRMGTAFRELLFTKRKKLLQPELQELYLASSLESLEVDDEDLHPVQVKLKGVWPQSLVWSDAVGSSLEDVREAVDLIFSERIDATIYQRGPSQTIPRFAQTHRPGEWCNFRYEPVKIGAFEEALATLLMSGKSPAEVIVTIREMMGAEAVSEAEAGEAVKDGIATLERAGIMAR